MKNRYEKASERAAVFLTCSWLLAVRLNEGAYESEQYDESIIDACFAMFIRPTCLLGSSWAMPTICRRTKAQIVSRSEGRAS